MANEKVLLVDDEKEFTETLKERLELRGMAVSTAASGQEALGILEKRSFDVIFLDLQMPGMDGIETLKQITLKDPDAQVILLTGHATVPTSVEAMKHGAVDYLTKPAEMADLTERIGAAAATRVALVEKRSIEKIEELMKRKGW
ncbi:MAG: response regulator [Myxococcales bacterium]|nr:MAG: response regulator [Myxococcales bacterium]